ncbi:flagellar hook assembly protein FlgD [Alteribacillus iranensis]|uniref:Flagellar basal-body rod modification protein FlgD n=1 Tax=Alteribacillus iranensis TaxID=930128 RepID=A0A1I2A4P8_9BACI|nr:flagellar hook assembly protein FlgD [Alteribacillus iranensis]SFE38932.1 flagellar basal-body rod modification protein FlgD [Alteribacillus iranensis]
MSDSIQETYAPPSTKGPEIVSKKESNILGKDDFMKILMAQLSNQDPLNPMEDKEFVAQMAQFSTLEQMVNINDAIQHLVHTKESGSLVQHSELIGKDVTWLREIEKEGMVIDTEEVEGTIQSVKRDADGNIRLLLQDDRWINSEQLLQVSAPVVNDSAEEEEAE